MRVLLATLNAKYIHTNLAIRLLYSLNLHHKGLAWHEFSIKEDFDEIADYCKNFEIIAFSCYIWNIKQTLAVAAKIKEINPEIKILLGGPEVSYDYDDVICLPQVDYIIVGEGETPFTEFLNQYPNLENVQSLVQKIDGNVMKSLNAPMFDLTQYENLMPYAFDEAESLRNKVCYVETSRGCPYKCEFCLASLDNKVRYLPMKHIHETMHFVMQHGKVIKFLDRTFNVKKDFTIGMFQFILDNYKPGNVFQFEITADIIHPDIIAYINEKVPEGLFRFEIGIQTLNQAANKEVSRKQNFEKTKAVILQLRDKVEMHLDLIVGLPLDRYDDIRSGFAEVFSLFPPELQLGFLKFLKGTPVRYKYESHGFVFDPEPPYQVIESNYLSKKEIHQIELLEETLEIYWNKKRCINTLKYVSLNYHIFDFLSGLGAYFHSVGDFHKHTFTEVYRIFYDFVKQTYPNDFKIIELLEIDYCLNSKIKPQPLFLEEISKTEKFEIIESEKLNHHQYRFLGLSISFDFQLFEKELIMNDSSSVLLIQYSGREKPKIVFHSNQEMVTKD